MTLIRRTLRKLLHIRLSPIHVYCLHHVTDVFDEGSMHRGDWISSSDFKQKITALRGGGVHFISLTEAYSHLCRDKVRMTKYAVLTFDDGYASLKEILPWLNEQAIPYVLFINGKYLDGVSYRKNPQERYLTTEELFQMNSPLVEIGSHGWEHLDALNMTPTQFKASVRRNQDILKPHPRFIPFFSYTYGHHTHEQDTILHSMSLIPLLVSGGKNYNYRITIDRELL